jgi:hypothetical protein
VDFIPLLSEMQHKKLCHSNTAVNILNFKSSPGTFVQLFTNQKNSLVYFMGGVMARFFIYILEMCIIPL